MATPPQLTFYDAVGGEPTFRRIVARFFAQVPQDQVLAAVYPLDDLDGAEERLLGYFESTATHMINADT